MADSARAQRAAALEEKRRRLEELKKQRARRNTDAAPRMAAAGNLDEYIDGLLSQPGVSAPAAVVENSTAPAENQAVEAPPVAAPAAAPSVAPTVNNVIAQQAPAPTPKVVETFAVSTQTDTDDFPEPKKMDDLVEEDVNQAREESESAEDARDTADAPESHDPRQLTTQEVEKEVTSKPFASFLNSASKKVERLFGAQAFPDLLVDYVGEEGQTRNDTRDTDANRFVTSLQVYKCEKWTQSRDITDIACNATHRDHILATYHMPKSTTAAAPKGSAAVKAISPNDTLSSSLTPRSGELQSDGLALVWSLAMPQRPEHIFTCGSPVTVGTFHPTESTLVIGGCESGQMVVWDTRAGRLPVQKSTLTSVSGASAKAHIHPINGMEVMTGNALVTSSSDGRVNFWSLGNLREPAESVMVGDSVSCLAVTEAESLLLGDEYGALYSVQSSQQQRRKQVRKLATVTKEGENLGHYGLVASLSSKTSSRSVLRGGLVLSAGVDWTIKLWSPARGDLPLTSFVSHSYDNMSDAKWSPTHPSLFATASSGGTIGLWDLAASLDDPLTGQEGIAVEGGGLSKLRWSADGRRLSVAAGDCLQVMTLTEDVTQPKGDEDTKMMNHLMSRGMIEQQ